ncbi:MAG: hypothetical protein AAGJ40_09015 [Planctomycetota bacterium]
MERHTKSGKMVAVTFLLIVILLTGCDQPSQTQAPKREVDLVDPNPVSKPTGEEMAAFQLYSTLAGKMARMEEILNGIDRFLDEPDFQERLIGDVQEFQQLLMESRGLYPKRLSVQDNPAFDRTIDETVTLAEELHGLLRTQDETAAREVLRKLDRIRQEAHTKFSY